MSYGHSCFLSPSNFSLLVIRFQFLCAEFLFIFDHFRIIFDNFLNWSKIEIFSDSFASFWRVFRKRLCFLSIYYCGQVSIFFWFAVRTRGSFFFVAVWDHFWGCCPGWPPLARIVDKTQHRTTLTMRRSARDLKYLLVRTWKRVK